MLIPPDTSMLSHEEKDALLREKDALIGQLVVRVQELVTRVQDLGSWVQKQPQLEQTTIV